MAVMCPQHIRHLVLVDAAGIRPQHGEVFDIFITPWRQVLERCFYDATHSPEYQRLFGGEFQEFGGPREAGRNHVDPHVFSAIHVTIGRYPACWRKCVSHAQSCGVPRTRLFPLNVDRMYQRAIPGATLQLIEQCGHWPQFERRKSSHDW